MEKANSYDTPWNGSMIFSFGRIKTSFFNFFCSKNTQ